MLLQHAEPQRLFSGSFPLLSDGRRNSSDAGASGLQGLSKAEELAAKSVAERGLAIRL